MRLRGIRLENGTGLWWSQIWQSKSTNKLVEIDGAVLRRLVEDETPFGYDMFDPTLWPGSQALSK